MKRSDSQVFFLILLANETYRSFASLRMTGLRFAVILSEAKDLHMAPMGYSAPIPLLSAKYL